MGFLTKNFAMFRNRMLADPSFLFKVGTEVCFLIFVVLNDAITIGYKMGLTFKYCFALCR